MPSFFSKSNDAPPVTRDKDAAIGAEHDGRASLQLDIRGRMEVLVHGRLVKNRPGICGCQSEIRVHVAPRSVVFADDSSPPRYTVLRDESPGSTRTIWLYSGWDCIRS